MKFSECPEKAYFWEYGKKNPVKFADIIIPLAVDGFFTYSLPSPLEDVVVTGMPVFVPFAGNKIYTGVVYSLHDKEPSGYVVKAVGGIAGEDIRFSEEDLRFLLWISGYYMATPGEVLKAALPVAFRLESFTSIALSGGEIEYESLTANEESVLNFLQPGQYVSIKEIEKYLKIKSGTGVVKSLLNKGYVQVQEVVDEAFKEKTEKWVKWAETFSEKALGEILDNLKRAPAQYKLLCKWIEAGGQETGKQQLLSESGQSPAVLKALCDKGILVQEDRTVSRLEVSGEQGGEARVLSVQQQGALDDIRQFFSVRDCVLLQGVTSSGKTEVYIHLIKEFLGQGKQVLYMLPEIALTVQIIKRLKRVFGDSIGIYHSGMPDKLRAEVWKKQCSAEPYQLVLGVRSSVFLPFRNLGLVIVDEEHDASYKQKEPAPRYQARDVAVMLGKFRNAKVLLGSATPSFETYQHARSGKYGHVVLDSRYGNVQMPEVVFANLPESRRKKIIKGTFTPLLYEEMKRVLDDGKQVILFQNRRGYSTYLQCSECGATVKCDHCDVSMTYYKQRGVLSCRYCGSLRKVPDSCGECGHGHYVERTPGTERIEEEVREFFPGVRVARMDMEVMANKARFRALVDDFEQGKIDVLIGTQMVSKGLDFENVKLVGVMDADSMVHFPDFRAEERAYCMLMQVSGRSGRKGERGKVVIQAGDMNNRVYRMLKQENYDAFFTSLAEERNLFCYPPFYRMIRVELRHKEVVPLRNAGNYLTGRLRMSLGKRVCGPAVPDVSRISGMHRLHLLLKIEPGASLTRIKSVLKQEFEMLITEKDYKSLRIFCDVDPA